MAKRRLNKNLVAFLTAAGIFLAVIVVAVAAFNAARKDPAVIAEKAATLEATGELDDIERAKRLFFNAFKRSNEAKYLIDAARCARAMGELGEVFMLLRQAESQSPNDPEILNALLLQYWEVRSYPFLQKWRDISDYSEKLLEQEPENLLALVYRSEALENTRENQADAVEADEVLARAVAIDPTSPYVALTRSKRSRTRVAEAVRDLIADGRRDEAQEAWDAARGERVTVLTPAVAAHPEEVALRIDLADALIDEEKWDQTRELLEAGVQLTPDDPDLRDATARYYYHDARRQADEAGAEVVQDLIKHGLEHVEKAIELEPVLYSSYTLRANLLQLGWEQDGSWAADPVGRQREILESFTAALRDTVGIRTFRSVLSNSARLQMTAAAFDLARSYHRGATNEDVKSQARTYMRHFLEEGQTRYRESAYVWLMQGHVALIDDDERGAVQAFREADDRGDPTFVGRLAKEELAKLYRRLGDLGLAVRYTDQALEIYAQQRLTPPIWLYANKAEVLLGLNREQEALDLVDALGTRFPDDDMLLAIRARALAMLGRGKEALAELEQAASDDPRILVDRARIAAFDKNYDEATRLLRRALEARPDHLATIRLLVQLLMNSDRQDEALQLVRDKIAATTDEYLRRVLQTYEVTLTTTDPEERQRKLLDIIAQLPNERDRAAEYFNYWVASDEYDKALPYLDQMERMRPDDVEVLRLQFNAALRSDNCERAEKYAVALTKLNADRVGGATYRGKYELNCGDPGKALSEFRTAEREFPTDTVLKVQIAQALLLMQPPHYEEAMQPLQRAVEFDPQNFTARKLLYMCYEQTGRRDAGIPHLKAARDLASRNGIEDDLIKQSGRLLDEEENPRQGIARREEERAANPQDVTNLLRLAELYDKVGDYTHSVERVEQGLELEPANVALARFGADLYRRNGDREAGTRVLEKHLAAQTGYGKTVARVLLGRFYAAMGDVDAGLNALLQARDQVDKDVSGASDDHRRAVILSASELAEFYRRLGRSEEMIDAYRVVLSRLNADETNENQIARRHIIRGELALGRLGEAEQDIREYLKDYPDEPGGVLADAELLLIRNQLDAARQRLTRVLELDPDNARAYYLRGRIGIDQRSYQAARSDLLRAKELLPLGFNLNHRLDIVRLCELTGEADLAEAELREMLPINRGESRVVEMRLIDLLVRGRQLEKAQSFVNELTTRDPDQAYWPYQLGKLLMMRQEYSAAARAIQTAVDMLEQQEEQIDPAVVQELLTALTRANRPSEAVHVYETLDAELTTPRTSVVVAEAYLDLRQRDTGMALIDQAVMAVAAGQVSDFDDLRFIIDRATRLLGKEEGLALTRRALAVAEDPTAKLSLRGTLARHLSSESDQARRTESMELAEAVIKEAPAGHLLQLEAMLVKGLLETESGQPKQAVETYEAVVRVVHEREGQLSDVNYRRSYLQALNNLAYLLADELGRPAEALPYAERLYEFSSETAAILDTVGWIYFKNGRNTRAEAVFLDALRVAPNNVATRYHLGQLYAETGRRQSAERAFQQALQVARQDQNEEYIAKTTEALQKLR